MTLKERIVALLEARTFEMKEGGSKMVCVESVDFEQIALDIIDTLKTDFALDVDPDTETQESK